MRLCLLLAKRSQRNILKRYTNLKNSRINMRPKPNSSPSLDSSLAHLFAYLDLFLETNLDVGLEEWRQVWAQLCESWQLGAARQLLQLIKRYPLTPLQQATLYTFEGQLLSQQGNWREALKAYEKSLVLAPSGVAALSGRGNTLRHIEGRAVDAVQCLQETLALADEKPARVR